MSLSMKPVFAASMLAAGLSYLSLLVPGQANAVCGNLGEPVVCPVLAYGFPLPFLADSQSTSPVGSVARDPLSLLTGLDDVLWLPLAVSASFWLLLVVIGMLAWRRLSASSPSSTSG